MGSVVGDVVGSVHEYAHNKDWKAPFFVSESTFTDDTVLSVATAVALLDGVDFERSYVDHFTRYHGLMANGPHGPGVGYGANFTEWALSENRSPYNSMGNGSAMRVGPVGWAYNDIESVLFHAKKSAECTHNHPEGVMGAQAVAAAVLMARLGLDADHIAGAIAQLSGFDSGLSLTLLNRMYTFDPTCNGSVSQALSCVLQAKSFEGTLRNCLYIGGDVDTIAAIACSIAEPLFGIPEEILSPAQSLLGGYAPDLLEDVRRFELRYGSRVLGRGATRGLAGDLKRAARGLRLHFSTSPEGL